MTGSQKASSTQSASSKQLGRGNAIEDWLRSLSTLIIGGITGTAHLIAFNGLLILLGSTPETLILLLSASVFWTAIGAGVAATIVRRLQRPLRLGVGLVLFLGMVFSTLPWLLKGLHSGLDGIGLIEIGVLEMLFQTAIVNLVVALPSALGGGLLTVLSEENQDNSGFRSRCRIALWICGAGGGVGAAALWGISLIDFSRSFFYVGGLCLLPALLLLLMDRVTKPAATASAGSFRTPQMPTSGSGIALLAGFVSGGALIWTGRVLPHVFGHDHSGPILLMLIMLLCAATALGALFAGIRYATRPLNPALAGLLLLGVSLLIPASLLPVWMSWLGPRLFDMPDVILWMAIDMKTLISIVTVIPLLIGIPALVSGFLLNTLLSPTFDTAVSSGSREGPILLRFGVSAALGIVVTYHLLIRFAGLDPTLFILAALATVGAAVIAIRCRLLAARATFIRMLLPTAFVLLAALPFRTPLAHTLLNRSIGAAHLESVASTQAPSATVTVLHNRISNERTLYINAVNATSTRLVLQQSSRVMGHLPALLHPRPLSGLWISVDAGMTVNSALAHPYDTLDVVDAFGTIHHGGDAAGHLRNRLAADGRVRIHNMDARHFLLRHPKRFDTISIDVIHPRSRESWQLYTLEFYRQVASRLTGDGLLIQKIPIHGISQTEFRSLVRTFAQAFPQMTLWMTIGHETYGMAAYAHLLASARPLRIDVLELSRRLREPLIATDLASMGMDDILEILDGFVTDLDGLRSWMDEVPIRRETDFRFPGWHDPWIRDTMEPTVLFSLHKPVHPRLTRMGDVDDDIRQSLQVARESNGFLLSNQLRMAKTLRPRGRKMELFRQEAARAEAYFLKLAAMVPDDAVKLFEIGSLLGNIGFSEHAETIFRRAYELRPRSIPIRMNLALNLMDLGKLSEAQKLLEKVVVDAPDNAQAHLNHGVVQKVMGDAQGAVASFSQALRFRPDMQDAAVELADALRRLGRLEEAADLLRAVIANNPRNAVARDTIGVVTLELGDTEGAVQHHREALQLYPWRAGIHYNMGIALERQRRWREAAGAYTAALTIDERDAEARNNLGVLYGRAGMIDEAIDQYLLALEIEPVFPEALFNLGLAWMAAGRPDAAMEVFELALSINPDMDAAAKQLAALKTLSVSGESRNSSISENDPTD